MGVYFRSVLRASGRLKRPAASAALVLLLPEVASACPICFGAVESPLLDAARIGVLTMAAVTLCVLGAFGAWFVRLARLQAQQSTIHDQPGIHHPPSVSEHSAVRGPHPGARAPQSS
jgi:hypothetical protein